MAQTMAAYGSGWLARDVNVSIIIIIIIFCIKKSVAVKLFGIFTKLDYFESMFLIVMSLLSMSKRVATRRCLNPTKKKSHGQSHSLWRSGQGNYRQLFHQNAR